MGSASTIISQHRLASGRDCRIERVHSFWLRRYFVLIVDAAASEPSEQEECELTAFGLREARSLAQLELNDPAAFVLILSGRSNRRRDGWHLHIVLATGRWQKAWLYFALFGKNLLQAIGLRTDRRRAA